MAAVCETLQVHADDESETLQVHADDESDDSEAGALDDLLGLGGALADASDDDAGDALVDDAFGRRARGAGASVSGAKDWWCGKISEEGVGLRMDKSLPMRRTVSARRERAARCEGW